MSRPHGLLEQTDRSVVRIVVSEETKQPCAYAQAARNRLREQGKNKTWKILQPDSESSGRLTF